MARETTSLLEYIYALVVELADTLDLKSSIARCEGSSPFWGTISGGLVVG